MAATGSQNQFFFQRENELAEEVLLQFTWSKLKVIKIIHTRKESSPAPEIQIYFPQVWHPPRRLSQKKEPWKSKSIKIDCFSDLKPYANKIPYLSKSAQ